ncbi:MAG: hypothetical protein QOE13_3134 [Gaiellaceae bacterium]|jgi:hypothetical protein|nr:hypothetical protein [Gaiellaceae bacterium]
MRILLRSVALAVIAVVVAVQPAGAEIQPAELAASDVVIEPAATVTAEDRARLEAAARELRDRGTPTKFVVVAARPVNPPQTARDLRRAIGFNGSVLVLSQSPRSLGIASGVPEPQIQEAFNSSVRQLQADPIGGMIAVAERLADQSTGGSDNPVVVAPGPVDEQDRGGGGGGGLALLGVLLVGFFAFLAITRRTRRVRAERDLADQQAALEPLIDALAAQIGDLGSDLRFGGDRATQAQPHYDEAVLAYGEVRDALPSARTGPALEGLRRTLERGLRAAQSARAVLDGRPLPPPEETALLQGMCAFDPKHGRSAREMPVVTPAGDEVVLPVCPRCAEGLEQGQMPDVRRVRRLGQEVPYWQGAGMMGFGGGGLFPMFGGFLGGMVLHDLFTPDVSFADTGDVGGGWGDSGGGDWGGGGDFGGGDFGGGDFGGGDFGGGGDF